MRTANSTTINRYGTMFAQLRAENRHALIPFTILGWPNPEVCLKSIDAFVAGGATGLELGLAFSDPMADGPLIQAAAKDTLEAGFTVNHAMDLLKTVRQKHPELPIGLLVYYNLVLARRIDRFFEQIGEAGADAVLIADLPPERFEEVLPAANENGVHLIAMISPLTDAARLRQIQQNAGGFLYTVSRLGITGVEERHDQSLTGLMESAKANASLPLCVGFGISKREHVEKMVNLGADGVIIGSSVMAQIQALAPEYPLESIQDYLKEMARPVR